MDGFVNPEKLAEESSRNLLTQWELLLNVLLSRYNVSRETQDEIAFESQTRTAAAQEAGKFTDEIIPNGNKDDA